MRHVGPQLPNQGSNPPTPQLEGEVPTTGPPGKLFARRDLRAHSSETEHLEGAGLIDSPVVKRLLSSMLVLFLRGSAEPCPQQMHYNHIGTSVSEKRNH